MATPKDLNEVNSIYLQPDKVLLDLVKKNDLNEIKLLIKERKYLINNVYDHPYYKPILHIACSEDNISPKTVQLLLNLGANPCIESDDEGEAIHIAARSAKSEILKVLINNTNCINHLYKGNTALLLLLKEGNTNNRNEFLESSKILIEKGVDVNKIDSKTMTAILWTIKRKFYELIDVFITSRREDLDLDTTTLDGKTARQLILKNKLSTLPLPDPNKIKPENVIFKYLKDYSEELFVNYNSGDLKQYANIDDGHETLLQLSCKSGLEKAVKHLLQNGAEPNLTTSKTRETPLDLASKNGYSQIVEQLLNVDDSLTVSGDVINKIIKNIDEPEYAECFKKLLNTLNKSSMNLEDEFLNTPLHLVVRYGQSEHIHAILDKGASLASKNKLGIMPIENIDPEILEEHLNNCIKIDTDNDNPTVSLYFETLMPPSKIPSLSDHIMEKGKHFENTTAAESEAIAYMCKTNHLKHLLIHPVIATFLLLKWNEIRWLFFANLGFYIIFFLSLVMYIFTSYGNFHYIRNSQPLSSISTIAYGFLCVTFFILILRELFQIVVAPSKYYKNFENWIELTLIVLIGCILFKNNSGNNARKQLSSVALLFSSFELVLMMGQHPKISTNVYMLKTVSFNFFKFLLWYSLLIIAFALGFYILFSEPVKEVKSGDNNVNSFVNPGSSVFKTVIMLTGEFDAGSIDFNSFPITSKLIFVLFILMIAITLLNLLNGLAVSDMQMIKNDAEYLGIVSQTQYVFYVESMLVRYMFLKSLIIFFQTVSCWFCCFCFFGLHPPFFDRERIFSAIVRRSPNMSSNTNKNKLSKKWFHFRFDSPYLDSNIIAKTKKIIRDKKVKQEENVYHTKMRELIEDFEKYMKIYINSECEHAV